MKVMLLAAGVGERMRPLTDHTPKPLLKVAGVALLEYHIRHLVDAGFREMVINVSHLGQQIIDYFGDGSRWGASIVYSRESVPLETAGGIIRALPLLGEAPFLIVNGDVWTDYPFVSLAACKPGANQSQAHLVFVSNPPQHPLGDYSLDQHSRVGIKEAEAIGLTYAGLGVYTPGFFAGEAPEKLALRPLLDKAIGAGAVSGEIYTGQWVDVGTPERLNALDESESKIQP